MSSLLCLLVSALPTQPLYTFEPTAPTESPVMSSPLEPSPLATYAPTAALAEGDMPELEYTYIEANYVWQDPEDFEDNLDGWEITGSLELPLNFFLQATYIDQDSDFDDVTRWRLGAGWHIGLIARLDAYGILSYEHVEFDNSDVDIDEDGVAGEIGLRFLLTPKIELNGRILWKDVEESEAGGGVGARFYFSDSLSVGANYDITDNNDTALAGLRFEF